MSGTTFPLIMTAQGAQPTPPATLNAAIIATAQIYAPGLTANLPGSLIEDIASTDTGALITIDQVRVDYVNSLTPYGANAFVLNQLGQVYLGQGSTAAPASNTAVYVQFTQTGGTGFVIAPGFIISDGTYQYTVAAPGGVTGEGGVSGLIFAQATQTGTWSVPAGTVTTIVSSLPSGITLAVTNPSAGTPGLAAETEESWRAQVLQAGLVAATGMPNYFKTLLQQVPGVEAQLISVRPPAANQWEIIVGGTGDPYQIGLAIFNAVSDISTLVGSTLAVTNITAASNGVVTTNLNHGYSTGQAVTIAGVNPSNYNQTYSSITVLTETTFETNVNTSGYGAYVSGGVCTPNFRNTSVTINSYPDSYTVPFVLPPVQTVTMTVTWNTSSLNYVNPLAVAQLVQPAIANYVNAILVGAPLNLLELDDVFIQAVASVMPKNLITVLLFSVSINGVPTSPSAGTKTIFGDPESYFSCAPASVTVQQS